MKIHDADRAKLKCSKCDTMMYKESLPAHMKIHDNDRTRIKCSICDAIVLKICLYSNSQLLMSSQLLQFFAVSLKILNFPPVGPYYFPPSDNLEYTPMRQTAQITRREKCQVWQLQDNSFNNNLSSIGTPKLHLVKFGQNLCWT